MLLSRVHALESQFNESEPLMVGVQDGRAKEEQKRAGVYYQMVASENGSYGVQAWFHMSSKKKKPEFARGKRGPPWAATKDVIRSRQNQSERAGDEHGGDRVAHTARGTIKFAAGVQRSKFS